MIELSRAAQISAPPPSVWRVLTDLAEYRTWTKIVRVDGEPRLGGLMTYEVAAQGGSARRLIRFECNVERVEPDRLLIWHFRFPGLIGLRFGFELQPADGGTSVRHFLQVSGLIPYLARGRFGRFYGPVLGTIVEDLARHMSERRTTALRVKPDIRRRRRTK